MRWSDIHGWFDYSWIYDQVLDSFGDNPASIVEIGCWLGASTAYMATGIKLRQKPITFYAVDTWKGADNESLQQPILAEHGGDIYDQFIRNMEACGVMEYVKPIRKASVDAAKDIGDGMLDFVFIDADHSYEAVKSDILAWLPKMKNNRYMAGHDIEREPIQQAATEVFGDKWERFQNVWFVKVFVPVADSLTTADTLTVSDYFT